MAKNRKTKKEKLRSVERNSRMTAEISSDTAPRERSIFTFVSSSHTKRPIDTILTSSHLREDLLRTGTVIGAIIIAELILFYTLTMR